MSGFDNDVVYSKNADFTQIDNLSPSESNGLSTNGQIWVGATSTNAGGTHINVGRIVSPLGTLSVGYSSPNITLDLTGGGNAVEHLTGNTGGAISPTANNINTIGAGSITISGSGSTLTTQLTGLTNHALQIGAGTSTLTQLGSGTTGQILQTNTTADPTWSTTTWPSTSTVNQILYSSATSVISGLATANGGVLTTSATGVPSIDTTNFSVLTTGVQMKGNNTNTAPPAGFIGQSITSSATGVAMTSGSPKTVASISLTAGIWDISAISSSSATGGTVLLSAHITNISITDNALTGTVGIEYFQINAAIPVISGVVPQYRVTLSGNTVYYLVVQVNYTSTTAPTNGRISATRVG